MNNKRLAGQLQALADDTRLRILALVADGAPSATEINQALGMSQPRVAHHLKVLVDAGYLEARRDGRFVRYTLPGDGFERRLAAVVLQAVRKPEGPPVEPASTTEYTQSARSPAAAVDGPAPMGKALPNPVPPPPESPGGEDEEDDRRREMEDFLL
jgi:DNA-binding transcriptional ArsR family regulator